MSTRGAIECFVKWDLMWSRPISYSKWHRAGARLWVMTVLGNISAGKAQGLAKIHSGSNTQ